MSLRGDDTHDTPIRVGINGFGRIGRQFYRAIHAYCADLQVVAVNDVGDPAVMTHLPKYDTSYGRFPGEVQKTRVRGGEA
jgi:glyceraldehyde 3-phosphate dehydrogenase